MKMKTQNGNALFIILIAVALFAALSYAVSRSMNGGSSNMSKERAQLHAAEILEYSKALSNAVTQIRLRGCADDQLSFDNPEVSGYENTNAPDDKTCHVFQPAGGGIRFQAPDAEVNDGDGPLATWYFDGRLSVADLGVCDDDTDPDCKDLKVLLRVNKPICDAINTQILGQAPDLSFTPDEALNIEKFDGTYSASTGTICADGAEMRSWCAYKNAFCGSFSAGNTGAADPHYTYVKVLRAQ